MLEQLQTLKDSLLARQSVVYCRLVETRGSTPQKAGAIMLVFPDGTQAGTLGGGCVEAEVKRRALAIQQTGQAEVSKFQLDSDYGWDDGLICGGRMQVLIDPLVDQHSRDYYVEVADRALQGEGVTEAVVYDAQASGLPAPIAYLFDDLGQVVTTTHPQYHSDGVPVTVQQQLKPLTSRPRPYAAHGVAFLPILRRCRLIIVGGGHVGKAVAEMATDVGFNVWIVDDRDEYTSEARFPRVERRIAGKIEEVLPQLEIHSDTYCLIVTRGHNHDERALFYLAERGARYVGLIGSRRKIKLIFDDLLNEGIAIESLRQVHAPVGIDIGSQTVPEIAVSICAELIAHRNLGVVPGRPQPVEA